jgi:hypothetical protein
MQGRHQSHPWNFFSIYLFVCLFVYLFLELEFELRASTLSYSTRPFIVLGSCKLFVEADFKL